MKRLPPCLIVESATAHASGVKETARGEGEDGPL